MINISPVLFTFSFLIFIVSCDRNLMLAETTEPKQQPEMVDGFIANSYRFHDQQHVVYEALSNQSSKPPIIILHQLPGLSEETLAYAKTLSNDFSVYLPLLFGETGMNSLLKGLYFIFTNGHWFPSENKPIHAWLKQFSYTISSNHPEQKMAVIGMCLTGNTPLAMLENPQINSVVVSQPTLPIIALSDKKQKSLDLSAQERAIMQQRLNSDDIKILGLRFQNDGLADRKKHLYLKQTYPVKFIDQEICNTDYAPFNLSENEHSVLIDSWNINLSENHPVNNRRFQVRKFLGSRLLNRGTEPMSHTCL